DRLARRQAQQVANALHGGIAVVLSLGEQLVRDDGPVRPPPNDIGEGAAAIDPELPHDLPPASAALAGASSGSTRASCDRHPRAGGDLSEIGARFPLSRE